MIPAALNVYMKWILWDIFVYSIKHLGPRWWFQTFLEFSPLLREMIQFDLRIFFKWVVQPPTRNIYCVFFLGGGTTLKLNAHDFGFNM